MSVEQWIARDARRPGHFWADNEIYDRYARLIGVNAFAVYMSLTRHADNHGTCYPSHQTLADDLGLSRATVLRAIHILERHELIHVDVRRLPVRGQTTNIYTLIQVAKTAVAESDSGSKTPVAVVDSGGATAVAVVDSQAKPLSTTATPPVSLQQGGYHTATPPVAVVDSHINNTHVNKTQLTTTTIPPPAPVLRLIPGGGGGGGGDVYERDDDGERIDVEIVDACEIESEQTRRAELVDQLVALGVWRSKAVEAVDAGTVTTEHDIVCCKRFVAASTAERPASTLWSNWLAGGDVPPLPQTTPSSVTPDLIAAARAMREESDRMQQTPVDTVGPAGIAAAIRQGSMRAFPAKKRAFDWVQP